MSFFASAKILADGAAWRIAGFGPAGQRLLDKTTTGTDDEQALSGMLLVQAGNRSVRLVADALLNGAANTVLVDILASIGTDAARNALEQVTEAPNPEEAAAATQALRDLDEIRRRAE